MFKILRKKFEEIIKNFKEGKIVKRLKYKKIEENDLKFLDKYVDHLVEVDASYEVAEKFVSELKKELIGKEVERRKIEEFIKENIRKSLEKLMKVENIDLNKIRERAKLENRPAILIFFGVNGVGKSLTISKIGLYLKNRGYKVLLAAGDTFRAAGSLQLERYAEKIGLAVVKGREKGDSCAIIYDAIKSAKSKGYDFVLADTSGRMHLDKNLMKELEKIVRVNKPDLKILILDSLAGSDVVMQTQKFEENIGIDGIIFAKNDINEKGGNILSICYIFKKPILFLGKGQKFEDLEEFNYKKFINYLVS